MSALKSVALAMDVARRRRDQAEQVQLQAQRAVQFAQGQLHQLESYAADSQARWATAAGLSVTPGLLQHHYQFMARLQQAIGLQASVIADLQRQFEATRQHRLAAEVRLAGLNQVMKNKLSARALLLARREQKQMDEFATLKYARGAGAMQLLESEHEY